MNKWLCIGAAAVFLAGPALSQNLEIDRMALQACVSNDDRIERLTCYDVLFGRPSDPPPLLPEVEPVAASDVTVIPDEVRKFLALLSAPTVTDEGVAVTVQETDTDKAVLTNPEGFLAELTERQTTGDTEAFRLSHDVFLAIRTLPDVGEDGMLLVSCENNITHLRAIWSEPFNRSAINSRFLFGDTLADTSQQREMVLRARPGGFELLGPRGLESIAMLGQAVSGQRLQIVTGSAADEIRSLFFDMEPLREALPLVARQCSWSVQTFRREF